MQQPLPIDIEAQTPAPARMTTPARARAARGGDDWRIDERTRRAGLRGLAKARAALDATRPLEQSREPDAA
jgi:hypothetical protein